MVDLLPATGGTDFLISDFQVKTVLKCIPHRAQGCCFSNCTIDYTLYTKSRFVKETLISFRASGAAPKVISISQAQEQTACPDKNNWHMSFLHAANMMMDSRVSPGGYPEEYFIALSCCNI